MRHQRSIYHYFIIGYARGQKVTLGITGWSIVGVLTLHYFRHLDVGFSFPDVENDIKGSTVIRIIRNMSWVHTVVKQVGFYLLSTCVE